MAVFTEVTLTEAAPLFLSLGIGQPLVLEGCSSGIENTNYFVTTDQGDYVLTLFERLTSQQLPFYLQLMKHLARRGIPVPDPQADKQGHILHNLCKKPAAVVTKLQGKSVMVPQVTHCQQLGSVLAQMHLAGQDYPNHQPNLRGLTWWRDVIPTLATYVMPEQVQLLNEELSYQEQLSQSSDYQTLPRGPIHADLFRDNVMFVNNQLSGCFDFYFAGWDTWLFDIAICLNDWCIDLATGILDQARAHALVAAYDQHRPLSNAELILFPTLLRAAALRFWCSRLWDWYLPRTAALLKPHDPTHFERILVLRKMDHWHYERN